MTPGPTSAHPHERASTSRNEIPDTETPALTSGCPHDREWVAGTGQPTWSFVVRWIGEMPTVLVHTWFHGGSLKSGQRLNTCSGACPARAIRTQTNREPRLIVTSWISCTWWHTTCCGRRLQTLGLAGTRRWHHQAWVSEALCAGHGRHFQILWRFLGVSILVSSTR